jgi:hypothetical protein
VTFDEFVNRHLSAVLRFAAVLTGDRTESEDIVQEVLIRHPESHAMAAAPGNLWQDPADRPTGRGRHSRSDRRSRGAGRPYNPFDSAAGCVDGWNQALFRSDIFLAAR